MADRPVPDHLADLLVFAPLGLLLSARDRIPDLAADGRRLLDDWRASDRIVTARMVGELAVKQAARTGSQLAERARRYDTHRHEPVADSASSTDSHDAAPLAPASPTLAAESPDLADKTPPLATAPVASTAAVTLPIPGYDTLSAFQVVQRLEGLSPTELDAVREHEQGGRGRQTILNRIAQLTTAS